MDRIYTNRRPGELRIHLEIADNEIADLLDDLGTPDFDAFPATREFIDMLRAAHSEFTGEGNPGGEGR